MNAVLRCPDDPECPFRAHADEPDALRKLEAHIGAHRRPVLDRMLRLYDVPASPAWRS